MKKLLWLSLIFAMAIPAFADFKIKVDGEAPTVSGPGEAAINNELEASFKNVINDLNTQLSELFPESPNKMLQAFGNASAYASHGATTRAYGGYKLFSATIGLTAGLQLPAGITSVMDDMENVGDTIENNHDINLGVSPNIFNAYIGLNMGVFKFLPENFGILKRDNFYIGLRFGYFNLPDFIEDFNFHSFTLGLTLNYQLIPNINLAGLVKWRGINLGTGFIYNGNTIKLSIPLDEIDEPTGSGVNIHMEPKAVLNMDVSTFIIPLEAITSIKLLIFNIPFGLGADLTFGSTSLGFGIDSDVNLNGLQYGLSEKKKGSLSVDASAKNSPSIFNFKIMTGIGISAGPVVFDIPITFYPASGYNIGITIGAVY